MRYSSHCAFFEYEDMRAVLLGLLLLVSSLALAGVIEGRAAYRAGDYNAAYLEFSAASDAGDMAGADGLAQMYRDLTIPNAHFAAGLEALDRAADRNHLGALKTLGQFVVVVNKTRAFDYFLRAAELGDPEAQVAVGRSYEQGLPGNRPDLDTAFSWFAKAASHGYAPGHYQLGRCYATGIAIPVNYDEAIRHYQLAIQGNVLAAFAPLAVMYERGHGVLKDPVESSSMLKKGADRGDATSMALLAVNFTRGFGVKEDNREAYKWLLIASARTNPDAGPLRNLVDNMMSELEKKLTPAQRAQALAQAKKWKVFVPASAGGGTV